MPPADLEFATFSDDPPWIVDLEKLEWLDGIDELRARTRAQVPELTRPRRYPSGVRALRVVKDLGLAVGLWAAFDRKKGGSHSKAGISRRMRKAAERLGPTYIKLGQIISSGQGLFPAELVHEFAKLRDRVPAEKFSVVRTVVEEELGRPLEAVFESFDREPLAAASIAQVHRATLRADAPGGAGTEVVVKIQRPAVSRLVHEDLKVMSWLAPFLIGRIPVAALTNPPALVELFAETITEELDFRLEAANMVDVAQSFKQLDQRGYVVPRPHPRLVTRRMLVMERLHGFAFDDVVGIENAGIDTEAIIHTGMVGFMEGCMLHGVFHGDLHGGNLFVMEDGRTALLDFGITARMTPKERLAFLRLLVTGSMNDAKGQIAAFRDLGGFPPDTDVDAVVRDLGLEGTPVDPTKVSADELIEEMQRVVKAMLAYGARLPKILMLFVKNMMFLDSAIGTLAPDLDLFKEIAKISQYFAQTHGATIAAQVGVDPASYNMDLDGIKSNFGVDPTETDSFTYRDLQERRELIRSRLKKAGG